MAEESSFINGLMYGGLSDTRTKILNADGDDKLCHNAIEEFIKMRAEKLKEKKNSNGDIAAKKKDYSADILLCIVLVASFCTILSFLPLTDIWTWIANLAQK